MSRINTFLTINTFLAFLRQYFARFGLRKKGSREVFYMSSPSRNVSSFKDAPLIERKEHRGVQIPTSAIFYIPIVQLNRKDKNKEKETENGTS